MKENRRANIVENDDSQIERERVGGYQTGASFN